MVLDAGDATLVKLVLNVTIGFKVWRLVLALGVLDVRQLFGSLEVGGGEVLLEIILRLEVADVSVWQVGIEIVLVLNAGEIALCDLVLDAHEVGGVGLLNLGELLFKVDISVDVAEVAIGKLVLDTLQIG